MSDDVDNSLLSRLQALRGEGGSPKIPASNPYGTSPLVHFNSVKMRTTNIHSIKFDVIERAKTPTKGDMLAARLKNLRSQADGPISPASAKTTERATTQTADAPGSKKTPTSEDDVDALFETDDRALEEMLADLDNPVTPEPESKDEHVHALLEQLSAQIPKDPDGNKAKQAADSDDSDGEQMAQEVDDVLARLKDEIQVEAQDGKQGQEPPPQGETDIALPSVPANPDLPQDTSPKPRGLDDITARMAALLAPTAQDDLPSVPTSKPSKRANKLTSRTSYTDDDAESWCTVCLEDATLRCLGCDGDVYCARCWREMHVGPAAAWDERSHKAVQFTRDGGKEGKIALGA
ncbi:hypothetical protein X797_009924 [Metarhizium robertsii]|uniref:Uncharacterized protein n=2 Tax=Metarhizium robertsii TaxID=568076 RepID=E9F793_METRA|nr:uncharacterized protein MAA_08130 [Metarhizium robertsii ARSEF 23]EFY96423.1 hypothetical protein MAA_08130 [Metarhizium robertsii ARSEF 23]EXU97006.1 hypothetical protein X797_009924 [Metarhizium robertsii]